MNEKINKFAAKCLVLSKLVKMRLAQPMLKGTVEESNKSLSASIKAVNFLSKIVPVLKISQGLVNRSVVSSRASKGVRKVGTDKLHNFEEKVWRVLKPGFEKETKHLRWRK